MERLTFEGNFCDIAQCAEIPGGSFCEDGACSQKKVWERLKAYEDAGLEPEEVPAVKLALMGKSVAEITEFEGVSIDRLKELAQADKEGRVVVLPCKVGDTVWLIDDRFCGHGRERIPIVKCRVDEFSVCGTTVAVLDCAERWYAVKRFTSVRISDFGKIAFLTREEAEQALERSMDNAVD